MDSASVAVSVSDHGALDILAALGGFFHSLCGLEPLPLSDSEN